MATRLKTVEYWFPELANVSDNTDTNFSQITLYLPETGTKTFVSAILECIIQDAETTANNINRRQLSLRLGSASYSTYNNTNQLTASNEQKWLIFSADTTQHFTDNWSGASMTCDARVLCDNSIATPVQGWRNATARLIITYQYDDSSTTQVKTVRWPLNAPITNLDSSKPASANDSIPQFDSELPEAGITFRQIAVIVQGNDETNTTTDYTISWEFDSLGAFTTTAHEGAMTTSCFYRHCEIASNPSTFASSPRDFFIWASGSFGAHPQCWLNVTYEYNESTSSTIMNSLLLPIEFDGPAGGITNADYQRVIRDLWIEEPTTITLKATAVFLFWSQQAAVNGISLRVNSGTFTSAYTSTAATVAGDCALMHRCESDISVARGENTITCDVYRTDAVDLMTGISGFYIVNYTSGKSSAGSGAHNKTIIKMIGDTTLTSEADNETIFAANSVSIPETNYFINSIGSWLIYQLNSTNRFNGAYVLAERLSAEDGLKWEPLYLDSAMSDSVTGVRQIFSASREIFKRWNGDGFQNRLDIETARRWRAGAAQVSATGSFKSLRLILNYHSIQFSVAGDITESSGGTVNLALHRSDTGELVKTTSRIGNGAFSFVWHDNTENVYVVARESGSLLGRSDDGLATGAP